MTAQYDYDETAQPVFEEEKLKDNTTLIIGVVAALTLVIAAVTAWVVRRRRIMRETRTAMKMLAEPKFFEAAEKRARAVQEALGKNAGGFSFRRPF